MYIMLTGIGSSKLASWQRVTRVKDNRNSLELAQQWLLKDPWEGGLYNLEGVHIIVQLERPESKVKVTDTGVGQDVWEGGENW